MQASGKRTTKLAHLWGTSRALSIFIDTVVIYVARLSLHLNHGKQFIFGSIMAVHCLDHGDASLQCLSHCSIWIQSVKLKCLFLKSHGQASATICISQLLEVVIFFALTLWIANKAHCSDDLVHLFVKKCTHLA